jgi:hypothetical protein
MTEDTAHRIEQLLKLLDELSDECIDISFDESPLESEEMSLVSKAGCFIEDAIAALMDAQKAAEKAAS